MQNIQTLAQCWFLSRLEFDATLEFSSDKMKIVKKERINMKVYAILYSFTAQT